MEKSARESQRDLNRVMEVDRINFNKKGVLMNDMMNKAPPTYVVLDKDNKVKLALVEVRKIEAQAEIWEESTQESIQ